MLHQFRRSCKATSGPVTLCMRCWSRVSGPFSHVVTCHHMLNLTCLQFALRHMHGTRQLPLFFAWAPNTHPTPAVAVCRHIPAHEVPCCLQAVRGQAAERRGIRAGEGSLPCVPNLLLSSWRVSCLSCVSDN